MAPRNDGLEDLLAMYPELAEDFSSEPPDERRGIIDELEAGSHELILEHNGAWNAKCRARQCTVEQRQGYEERIRAPYRFNLQATTFDTAHWTQLEKPNRRFFHISCFEAIGIDVAQYLTLPQPQVHRTVMGGAVSWESFHPAIVDWLANAGSAFDAHLYEEYADARDTYVREDSLRSITHQRNCSTEKCTCGSPPAEPNRQDFLKGQSSKRPLSDVLLQVLRVPRGTRAPSWLFEITGPARQSPLNESTMEPEGV